MLASLLIVLTFSLTSFGEPAPAAEIRVGGYHFEPYINMDEKIISGKTLDIINELNSAQKEFKYVFFPTTPKRRYKDLLEGKYDIIFFEDPLWGWRPQDITASEEVLVGQELLIAKSQPDRDQSYFDTLKAKRIRCMLGYHYRLLDYKINDTPKDLTVILTKSQSDNIQAVLNGQAELALTNNRYLETYLEKNPQYKSQLLVRTEPDHTYSLRFITKKDGRISPEQLKAITKMACHILARNKQGNCKMTDLSAEKDTL